METSEQINEIAAALAKAQGEIKGAIKDATNPHFKSQYATLSAVWDACRAQLSKNGLAAVQTVSTDENVTVTTMLAHSSGQWIKDSIACKPEKATAQGIGSAITYMRRYALSAIAGVAPDDDDGEAAVGRMEPAKAPKIMGRVADTKIKNSMRELAGFIEQAQDEDELIGILNDPAHIKMIEDCQKHVPAWWSGGDGMPEEFVPMQDRIDRKRAALQGDSVGVA